MAAHAKKSASGAKRWLNCPGSIEMTDRLPSSHRRRSSEPAMLGTSAHGLGEHCLTAGLRTSRGFIGQAIGLDAQEDAHVLSPDETRLELGESYDGSPYHRVFPIDDDMAAAVDVYLETVWGIFDSLPGSELMVEKRFDLTWLREDMFGTGDATIFEFMGRIYVIDYKHGQGVTVEVVDHDGTPNVQEMYYGLGLAEEVEWLFEDMELIIVQPRKEHPDGPVRSVVVTKSELKEFMRHLAAGSDMVETARANPEQHLQPGDWCGFCPVAPTCPALIDMAQHTAAMDFADEPYDLEVPEVDVDHMARIGQILRWTPKIDSFLRATAALAERLQMQGIPVPEQKLVRGRANRRFNIPSDDVVARVVAAGVEESRLFTDPKLKSPAQVEKLSKEAKAVVQGVKNKKHDPTDPLSPYWLVEPIAVKGEGKITMVHESDPREAVAVDAASDFEEDLEPEEE
jgi:hypothetical protein